MENRHNILGQFLDIVKCEKNVAETDDIAPVGIDYRILAYFLLFNYSSLSKIFSKTTFQ